MEKNTFASTMRRIGQAGFQPEFVREVLLPDWWEPAYEQDPDLMSEIEVRIARFFGVSIENVRRKDQPLIVPTYPSARLRRVRSVDADKLGAAIHAGLQIAAAVVRSLRAPDVAPSPPPSDSRNWYEQVRGKSGRFDFESCVSDLWTRGIPIVHVELLPTPKFQGLACIVENRPVVLLGHANDEPARLAFHLGHEVGHIANADCAPDAPVVDEDESVLDLTEMERRADDFAWRAMSGGQVIPAADGTNFREWAGRAEEIEERLGIDAGVAIWSWANSTRDFQTGQLALKALYLAQGGQRILRDHFDRYVDVEKSSETDRALLKCIHLDPDRDATAS